MSIIEINGLTKDYGNHKGIFDLSFDVREGKGRYSDILARTVPEKLLPSAT